MEKLKGNNFRRNKGISRDVKKEGSTKNVNSQLQIGDKKRPIFLQNCTKDREKG